MMRTARTEILRLETLEERLQPARIWYPEFPELNPLPANNGWLSLADLPASASRVLELPIQQSGKTSIGDLDVVLSMNNEHLANYAYTLISPQGTEVRLKTSGDFQGAFNRLVFDDQAQLSLPVGSANVQCRFTPATPLSSFMGQSLNGNWQLRITNIQTDNAPPDFIHVSLGITTNGLDDHSNTVSGPQAIDLATRLVPQTASTWAESGRLSYGGDIDVFTWTAPSKGGFEVKVRAANGSQFYPDMYIFDATQQYLRQFNGDAFVATGGPLGGSASRLASAVAGVSYVITVGDNHGQLLGNYTVELTAYNDDQVDEPLNPAITSVRGGSLDITRGSINRLGDVDWFKIDVPGTGATTVTLTGLDMFSGEYSIWSASNRGTQLVSGWFSSLGSAKQANFVPSQDNQYYLRVSGNSGNYQFTVTTTGYEDDYGDTPATAGYLETYADYFSAFGSINISGDRDLFQIPTPQGQLANIEVYPVGLDGFQIDYNFLTITIVDAFGNVVEVEDEMDGTVSSVYQNRTNVLGTVQLVFLVPDNNPYYVRVSGRQGRTGDYWVDVHNQVFVDDPFDDDMGAPLIQDSDFANIFSATGTIDHASDTDWFYWEAPADGSVDLYATSIDFDVRLKIAVFPIDGIDSEIQDDPDTRNNEKFGFSFDVIAGEFYFISIRDVGFSTGFYLIDLAFNEGTADPDINRYYEGLGVYLYDHFETSNNGFTGSVIGILDFQSDIDVIEWTAPDNGLASFSMNAANSAIFPDIYVFSQEGQPNGRGLSFDPSTRVAARGGPLGGIASVTFEAVKGTTYYFTQGDNRGRGIGLFESFISLASDDYGNNINEAYLMTLSASNSISGYINFNTDADWFEFIAPVNGTVTMQATGARAELRDGFGNRVSNDRIARGSQYFVNVSPLSTDFENPYSYVFELAVLADPGESIPVDIGIPPVVPNQQMPSIGIANNVNNVAIVSVIASPSTLVQVGIGIAAASTVIAARMGADSATTENTVGSDTSTLIDALANVGAATNATSVAGDIVRQIGDAQQQLLNEFRGLFSLIHTGALEQLLIDGAGTRAPLPAHVVDAVVPVVDSLVHGLDEFERNGMQLIDLTMGGLKQVVAAVPTDWFEAVVPLVADVVPEEQKTNIISGWWPWASAVFLAGTWRERRAKSQTWRARDESPVS